ncbi:MAG: hypothetical protein B6I38_02600 [Anaerolineaceae bacterium 4572_5.1]|nr:MAG: hypothetical protein B6I38_02600 [Anaerolineaceae bacterium 4572_5.1]RLD10312.1 MAG: hypothetical protein DRI56_02800 [Chloroflexota bacterium]
MRKRKTYSQRGQSFVELALLLPVLLIIISGMVELGFFLSQYLALQDAVRNSARFTSDSLYYISDNDHTCSTTLDFYRQAACLVNQELRMDHPLIVMSDNGTPNDTSDDIVDPTRGDDIIVSVFTITGGSHPTVTARFPTSAGESGWSYAEDIPGYGMRNLNSSFSSADIESKLNVAAPSTGFVLVELYYHYDHFLKLPWILAFIPDPILLKSYSLMPNVSAEPTTTPIP